MALGKRIADLDTPALLIDLEKLEYNLKFMQEVADQAGVKLRPHFKTHKSVDVAKMQLELGACGITVAKVSEAEAILREGISDVFIATQVVGPEKLRKLCMLSKENNIRLAIDSIDHVEHMITVFGDVKEIPIGLMIEIDTGLNRCGVKPGEEALLLAEEIMSKFPQTRIVGIFTHEGMVYNSETHEQLRQTAKLAQVNMIETGNLLKEKLGISCEVSIGCTLAVLGGEILPGITEIRPGTYVFYDGQHAGFFGHTDFCAATILSVITTKKGNERVVADAGAKSFTIDRKTKGICASNGIGRIKQQPHRVIERLSDEHAVIIPGDSIEIGDLIEIIPNHICPSVNLYDWAFGIRNGIVEKMIPISARGCNQ
jgi:D-serine deaminase-like pyridoxal phosphate-dependent protein